jgi:hypothetical protein
MQNTGGNYIATDGVVIDVPGGKIRIDAWALDLAIGEGVTEIDGVRLKWLIECRFGSPLSRRLTGRRWTAEWEFDADLDREPFYSR